MLVVGEKDLDSLAFRKSVIVGEKPSLPELMSRIHVGMLSCLELF